MRIHSLLVVSIALLGAGAPERAKTRLFILSGQSNMAGLNHTLTFIPTITKAFPGDELIFLKDAKGGQPIRRWYKKWAPSGGKAPEGNGDLYDGLMKKVRAAVGDRKPDTITFLWMQGERDARGTGNVYARSLKGLIVQLREDLGRKDVDFVVGRISDFKSGSYKDWDIVRKAIVEVAEADPRGAWVDTDDLNGPKDGLHYTKEGYRTFGTRLAEKAIALIRKSEK